MDQPSNLYMAGIPAIKKAGFDPSDPSQLIKVV